MALLCLQHLKQNEDQLHLVYIWPLLSGLYQALYFFFFHLSTTILPTGLSASFSSFLLLSAPSPSRFIAFYQLFLQIFIWGLILDLQISVEMPPQKSSPCPAHLEQQSVPPFLYSVSFCCIFIIALITIKQPLSGVFVY